MQIYIEINIHILEFCTRQMVTGKKRELSHPDINDDGGLSSACLLTPGFSQGFGGEAIFSGTTYCLTGYSVCKPKSNNSVNQLSHSQHLSKDLRMKQVRNVISCEGCC